MLEKYYLEKLYPLQDKVLEVLQQAGISHYLTGGTVVGRCFLHHRHSDDLDFFLNNDSEFTTVTEKAIKALQLHFSNVTIDLKDTAYFRVYVLSDDFKLKIDFVNDVGYHYGQIQTHPLFFRIDNLRNILSNKLTALGRLEAKDVIDIIYIAKAISFNWPDVIAEAGKKEMWCNEVDVMNYLKQAPLETFISKIAWMKQPGIEDLRDAFNKLLLDIAIGAKNSLCNV